jgi:ribosomal protein S27E
MSDRKYRQRGYQDDGREGRREQQKPAAKKEYAPRGQPPIAPKTFNMPGFREVVRCARCGNELTVAASWSAEGKCARCGADLHTCAQCVHFDTSAAFECQKPVPARISPKDTLNACPFYEPRITVERETKSSTAGTPSARKAFDDLFK